MNIISREHLVIAEDDLPTHFIDAVTIRGGTNRDTHFETYGVDLAFVTKVEELWPGHVWTDVDGADVSGLHYVNRLCYRLALNPVLSDEFTVTVPYRIECEAEGCDDDCDVCQGTGDLYIEDPDQVEGRDPNPQRAFQLDFAIDIYDLRRLWRQVVKEN